MSAKRKDSKGRVLRDGESQRTDGRYQYRYTDPSGKRHTVYDTDLKSLRETEEEIQKRLTGGVDYASGNITVIELVERYLELKQGIRQNTKDQYTSVLNNLYKDPFGSKIISSVKISDAKRWFISMHNNGRKFSTIKVTRAVLKPAFQMAYEEDAIPKNPFDFNLGDVIKNDASARIALTPEQQSKWLEFVRTSSQYAEYYDYYVVLFGTGLRANEFCGLTVSNLDFENRKIIVDHQIAQDSHGVLRIESPKTKSGTRCIPMLDDVYDSLKNMCANRPKLKVEPMVDGLTGFLVLTRNNTPRTDGTLGAITANIWSAYNTLHPDDPLPYISPHVCRHTFCTTMANSGMDIKALQYIMGHSNSSVTLDVYTHAGYDHAASQMASIVDFGQAKARIAR